MVPAKSHQQTTPQNGRTQTTADVSSNPAPGADNTADNQADQAAPATTADQQGNGKMDVQLTASIRRSIVSDGSLSTYAHNVKIVVQNGVATLKGPVRTQEEKASVAAKAAAVVGQENVVDQMEIAIRCDYAGLVALIGLTVRQTRAHPYFRRGGQPKPDLLIQQPGTGENYAIIEVKSCRAVARDIHKDLQTLSVFRNQVGYQRAIYLIYGGDVARTAVRVERCAALNAEIPPFELWLHQAAGTPL